MHLVLSHEQADFDAVASLLAARLLESEALAVLPRRLNRNVKAFLDLYGDDPQLRARVTLVAFSRSAECPEFLREAGVECRRIDYADVDSFGGRLEDLDGFVHFAGALRTVSPAEFYTGNRDATATVVDAACR